MYDQASIRYQCFFKLFFFHLCSLC